MACFRSENLERLRSLSECDALIIGGGVNGVGVLRELALNNVSAVLIDQGDFCAGATSASTRMAHGGLRYLETREFDLVSESLRERNLLLVNAPHQTVPLEVVVPLEHRVRGFIGTLLSFFGFRGARSRLNALSLKAALLLYERLGGAGNKLRRHSMIWRRSRLPAWLPDRYRAAASYFDGRLKHPETLVFEMIEDALTATDQVAALNHVAWTVSAEGLFEITDSESGTRLSVKPKIIINATGAWLDQVNGVLGLQTKYVTAVKGAHIIVENEELRRHLDGRAFYYDDGSGRMVVCYPLDRTILMGTTEVAIEDPNDLRVTPEEISYLRDSLTRLTENIEITDDQIVAATTGCRPLRNAGASSLYSASRGHAIHRDKALNGNISVLSMAGGKWTTFRSFAEEVADLVQAEISVDRQVSTAERKYPGTSDALSHQAQPTSSDSPCNSFTSTHSTALSERYGTIGREIAEFCKSGPDRRLAALPHYTEREIAWLIERRSVRKLDDLVLRRTRIALDGLATEATLRELSSILSARLDKPPTWAETEVTRCLAISAVTLRSVAMASPNSNEDHSA